MNARVWSGRRAGVAFLGALALAVTGCGTGPVGPGTRGEPIGVGVVAGVGSWDVAVGSTIADADAIVGLGDPTNRPPPEGRHFVLVPLRLVYHGPAVGRPWLDLDVRYVTREGRMYGESEVDQCGSVPGSLEFADETPPGVVRWGNACVAVPSDALGGGAWIVRNGGHWGWTGFFAASSDAPSGPGTRADPTPVGIQADAGTYSVAAGVTNPDAFNLIRAHDENAEGPKSGRRYVLAPLTVTFRGGNASGEPWTDLSVTWVGPDGSTYGAAEVDSCGDVPEPLGNAGVLAPGASVTGNVCIRVPADAVAGGIWHVVPEGTAHVWEGFFAVS